VGINVSGGDSLKPHSRRTLETLVLQQAQHEAGQPRSVTAPGRAHGQCHAQLEPLQADLVPSQARFVSGQVWPTCCKLFFQAKHQV